MAIVTITEIPNSEVEPNNAFLAEKGSILNEVEKAFTL